MDKLGLQRKLQICTASQRDELSSTLYSRILLTGIGAPIPICHIMTKTNYPAPYALVDGDRG